MAKKETVYDRVFDLYGLKSAPTATKAKIRKFIRRRLIKAYQTTDWAKLSDREKDYFLYVAIREDMLDNYVDDSKHKKIITTIDNYLEQTLLYSQMDVQLHNDSVAHIFEKRFSESTKEEDYQWLCKTIHAFNERIPCPSFEEWEKRPLRPYDYIASYENEPPEIKQEYEPQQSRIDHIILQVLLKVIKEHIGIEVDTELIEECLTYLDNHEIDQYASRLEKPDPSLTIPIEEQDKLIRGDLLYTTYKKMLETLSFTK